jgi:hypothetical protein
MKNALAKPNKTTKGKVLRYIREQQEKNFKEMFDKSVSKNTKLEAVLPEPLVESPKSDFEDSVYYLKSIADEEDNKKTGNNTTIRNKPVSDSSFFESILSENGSPSRENHEIYQGQNIINQIGPASNQVLNDFRLKPRMVLPEPKYGCLKNGKLPTYRMMMNQTVKNNRPPFGKNEHISIVNTQPSHTYSGPPVVSPTLLDQSNQLNTNPANIEQRMKNEKLKNISEMKQLR